MLKVHSEACDLLQNVRFPCSNKLKLLFLKQLFFFYSVSIKQSSCEGSISVCSEQLLFSIQRATHKKERKKERRKIIKKEKKHNAKTGDMHNILNSSYTLTWLYIITLQRIGSDVEVKFAKRCT